MSEISELAFPTSLGSDNHSGVHPKVMQALAEVNHGHAHAYGMDAMCDLAAQEFRRVFGETCEAHYVFTGTAANILCLAPLVRSFEAVICSEEAHLHVDECGAPEKFLGAKLWTLPSGDGKIRPEQCAQALSRPGDQHFSQARVVSLTQPTESGACYTLNELREWRDFCRAKKLMLHIDGARLVNAAITLHCELRDITQFADAVSFGGTKNGLMGAEACLLFSPEAKTNFKFYRKQATQLSSKTRFLAAQFYVFLKDDLWREIATHAVTSAREIGAALKDFPEVRLMQKIESNALFVELPKAWIGPLKKQFFFYVWRGETLCRWMTSFDWTPDKTRALIAALREVQQCFPVK